jgi:hypothetical protein
MNYFRVKENSLVAKFAAKKLKSSNVAIVFGSCIHLYGVSKEQFLSNQKWLRHELKHVEQYKKLGFLPFVLKYLWQTARVGYYRCGLECEAREAENDEKILARFSLKDKSSTTA